MNSVGLLFFTELCALGNALEQLRDFSVPESDQWLWHTEVLADLDTLINLLVESQGFVEDDTD